MKRNPDITILMSVRNGEVFIKEAVSSILNQTYTNFILLIVDNASTDKTKSIIKDFKDPRIKLIQLPEDVGQIRALNKGLSMIKSKFVARMDADDISVADRLNKQRAYIIENKLDLIGSDVTVIDKNGDDIYQVIHPKTHQQIINALNVGNPLSHSAVMMRREALAKVGFYNTDLKYAEDWDLWRRFVLAGYKIGNISEKLVKIRRHENQSTSLKRNKMILYHSIRSVLESERILPHDQIYKHFIWSNNMYVIFRLLLLGSFKIQKNSLEIKFTLKSAKFFFQLLINDFRNYKYAGKADLYNNYSLIPPKSHVLINK